jgi:hypothetical protein
MKKQTKLSVLLRSLFTILTLIISIFSFNQKFALANNIQVVSKTGTVQTYGLCSWGTGMSQLGDPVAIISGPDPGFTFTHMDTMNIYLVVVSTDYYQTTYISGGGIEVKVTDDGGRVLYDNTFTNFQPLGRGVYGSTRSALVSRDYYNPYIYRISLPAIDAPYGTSNFRISLFNKGINLSPRSGLIGVINNYQPIYYDPTTSGASYYVQITDNFVTNVTEIDAIAQQTLNAANNAATAANNTVSYAQQAQQAAQAAQDAANQVNTIVNSTLTTSAGVVQDSSGTVLTAARAAQANAQNAYNAASQADTDIKNAQSSLSNQLNNLQNSLSNQMNQLQTNITNTVQSAMPPILFKVYGYNGANATSSTSFKVSLDYTNATDYRYAVDGNWSNWYSLSGYNGYITVDGLISKAMHQITVEIRNGTTGQTARGSMTVFKL